MTESNDVFFIKIKGVDPGDFPEWEANNGREDEAIALARDLHDLVVEEYGKDIDGVVPVVNQNAHRQLLTATE